MPRLLKIAPLVLLAGCALRYEPVAIHVYVAETYAADVKECLAAGESWKPTFSFATAAKTTLLGASANSSLIPINPLVPVYGAAGGIASSVADAVGIAGTSKYNVAKHCLHDEVEIDHSAVVANPDD